jgi:SAM-dependent methyltransferase
LFKQSTDLFDGSPKTMLHVAPERFLTDRLDRIENLDYVSADISSPLARVKMDITDIRYPDDSFSVIYCSHVLEHVPDDRAALRELYRVLKPGGWAVLQVPITAAETFEDPNVTDPDERARVFGQWDHVRRCGPDYIDRMRAAGFIAETLSATEVIPAGRCARLGIQRDRLIFLCTK